MTVDDSWLLRCTDLSPEDIAAHIAKVLRTEQASRTFQLTLAAMFDPDGKTPFRAVLKRNGKGQPRRPANYELAAAMIEATANLPRGKAKSVAADIAARHGVSVRTAYAEMHREQEARELFSWLTKNIS